MKIFGLVLLQRDAQPLRLLCSEYELSSFGYFQRSSIQEFMTFFAKTLAERNPQPGQRQSVANEDYMGHVYSRTAEISAVMITDKEYTPRVAFAVLNKVMDAFQTQFPTRQSWSQPPLLLADLKDIMVRYQNPHEADSLLRVQKELDETKIIMHKTIESVLQRGDRLDDLVNKSEELSMASKAFYKTAKQTNSCCKIM